MALKRPQKELFWSKKGTCPKKVPKADRNSTKKGHKKGCFGPKKKQIRTYLQKQKPVFQIKNTGFS